MWLMILNLLVTRVFFISSVLFEKSLVSVFSTLLFLFFPAIMHPAQLSSRMSDAVRMVWRGCREVVKKFHWGPVNYSCSWGHGRKEGEPSLYLSRAGSQESRGYHACQELQSLITEETLSYFFFSCLIAYPKIRQLICQHPTQLSAESGNKWVSEDFPATTSVITDTARTAAATLVRYQPIFTVSVGDRDQCEALVQSFF